MKYLITLLLTTTAFSAIPDNLANIAKQGYKYALDKNLAHNPVTVVVDYSLPSNQKRLWLYDVEKNKTLLETYVAHGKNSGLVSATKFSDHPRSLMSSIGFYQIGNSYYGKHGLSLRLNGLEPENKSALSRGIVIHSANYVQDSYINANNRAGRSWGCFAVTKEDEAKIIQATKNNSLLLAYYPNQKWLHSSKFFD